MTNTFTCFLVFQRGNELILNTLVLVNSIQLELRKKKKKGREWRNIQSNLAIEYGIQNRLLRNKNLT